MKKVLLLVFTTVALFLGFSISSNQPVAHAASTIPVSMRGHYINRDNHDHMRITAHHVRFVGKTRHVHYLSKSGSWRVIHFYHASPIYVHKSAHSSVLHLEYGMSIRVTYHKY
ncbi:hypothetical protein ACFP1H_08980 [Secundilactobacillus hailunensis]|uniref:Uncharacterized protein n=1 Tax=Secundilactobacillus hailunensis TaxID=2559923 RepID=A0ABW1TAM5_9LACO|nr:hypothetical protein [Secundilactobacillus hailunensis]